MKKKYIVQRKEEFNEIIRNNKSYKNKYLSIYIRKSKFDYSRFGISIPKKFGHAVERNRIKRQLKEIIDYNKNLFKNNKDYIIIVRDAIKNEHFKEKEKILVNMIKIIENDEVLNEK